MLLLTSIIAIDRSRMGEITYLRIVSYTLPRYNHDGWKFCKLFYGSKITDSPTQTYREKNGQPFLSPSSGLCTTSVDV